MKFGFKHIILAAALMSAGSLTAQEQNDKTSFQKYNWFVTGAVNGEWLSNTTGNMIVGGKVGAGIQLTRYSAFRINAFAGKNRVKTMRAQQYGAELDYMLTLVGNKGYQPFNLAAIVGASYNYFNTNKLDIDNKNVSSIGGKIALQASYNLNRKLSLFIEPSFTILPKYYKGKDADDVFVQSGVNIGVTYSFKDKYKTSRKTKNEAFARQNRHTGNQRQDEPYAGRNQATETGIAEHSKGGSRKEHRYRACPTERYHFRRYPL